jgi:hypothetical protein
MLAICVSAYRAGTFLVHHAKSFRSVTSSRFERQLRAGQHDLLFKVVFGSDAKAGRALGVSRMQVWRWRHDRSPLPEWALDILDDLVQSKVVEAHEAQNELRDFRSHPPRPPRKLTGCCAGRHRRAKKLPVTPEDWAALG